MVVVTCHGWKASNIITYFLIQLKVSFIERMDLLPTLKEDATGNPSSDWFMKSNDDHQKSALPLSAQVRCFHSVYWPAKVVRMTFGQLHGNHSADPAAVGCCHSLRFASISYHLVQQVPMTSEFALFPQWYDVLHGRFMIQTISTSINADAASNRYRTECRLLTGVRGSRSYPPSQIA